MQFSIYKVIKPAHLNPVGTLFGGKALEWIDEEATIFAGFAIDSTLVLTKSISGIQFKHPARQGDILEIGFAVVALGRTSVTVSAVIRNRVTKKEVMTVHEMVFVNINTDGVPEAHGKVLEAVNT